MRKSRELYAGSFLRCVSFTMCQKNSSLKWTMGLGFTLLAALMGKFNFLKNK